jgi:hypothetical protein
VTDLNRGKWNRGSGRRPTTAVGVSRSSWTSYGRASLKPMGEASPGVVEDGWGFVEIEGLGRFRDVKLWPGGGRAWDWRETGTDHRPGVLSADVAELLDHEPDLVILSRGRQGRLGVSPETLSLLETHGVSVLRENTDAALATYNRLAAEGRRVAALFHTTC